MKDKRLYFTKMLEYIRKAREYAQGVTYEDFAEDSQKMFACAFAICQISELAQRVKDEDKKLHAVIPWNAIRAMRNHIVHNYDHIDKEILWDTVAVDLPKLGAELEKILQLD
ncbi:MAG: DUF86 domain-containing protein [Clostridiales bacterium]|jgi:uncharacterized protein with HEPN domain|nr:DUF86 domain-containing protein [Clostridiales bacterium]